MSNLESLGTLAELVTLVPSCGSDATTKILRNTIHLVYLYTMAETLLFRLVLECSKIANTPHIKIYAGKYNIKVLDCMKLLCISTRNDYVETCVVSYKLDFS
ncbi:unnamed protein product [Lasius platythorax]|uniref:Uncharacterized protein n=1 Tax=Lasius platythorax TaxID=488582 RepID=A0AAV2NYD4_9HYME